MGEKKKFRARNVVLAITIILVLAVLGFWIYDSVYPYMVYRSRVKKLDSYGAKILWDDSGFLDSAVTKRLDLTKEEWAKLKAEILQNGWETSQLYEEVDELSKEYFTKEESSRPLEKYTRINSPAVDIPGIQEAKTIYERMLVAELGNRVVIEYRALLTRSGFKW